MKIFSENACEGIKKLIRILHESIAKLKEGCVTSDILYFFIQESGYIEEILKGEGNQGEFRINNLSKYSTFKVKFMFGIKFGLVVLLGFNTDSKPLTK